MATIVLTRSSEYVNRLRDYGVFIDGKKFGTIANGETTELSLSSGQHSLVTKIDWCSSSTLTFVMGENEVKNFKVGGFKNAKWLMPTAFILIILSYLLSWKYEFDFSFYLVVPAFLLLVYYLTFGRKRYLTLTETMTEQHETVSA